MGSQGRVRADYPTNEVWIQSKIKQEYEDRTYIVKAPPILPENWPSAAANMYVEETAEFADSISGGRKPAIPGEAGVDVLRVIEGLRKSSDSSGGKVAL